MTGRTDQRISEATIKKVRKAAADLSYRPNLTAKTLRTGKSGTVGLVSDFIGTTSHANSMVMGALDVLRDKGKLLFTVDTQGDADVESKSIKALLDRQVDGVIYAAMFTREAKVPAVLRTVPTVLLNCLDETDDGRQIVRSPAWFLMNIRLGAMRPVCCWKRGILIVLFLRAAFQKALLVVFDGGLGVHGRCPSVCRVLTIH